MKVVQCLLDLFVKFGTCTPCWIYVDLIYCYYSLFMRRHCKTSRNEDSSGSNICAGIMRHFIITEIVRLVDRSTTGERMFVLNILTFIENHTQLLTIIYFTFLLLVFSYEVNYFFVDCLNI